MARSSRQTKNAPKLIAEDVGRLEVASDLLPVAQDLAGLPQRATSPIEPKVGRNGGDEPADRLPHQAASPIELKALLEEATALVEPQYRTLLTGLKLGVSPGVPPAALVLFSARASHRVVELATYGLPGDEPEKEAVENAIGRLFATIFEMIAREGEPPDAKLALQLTELITLLQGVRKGLRTEHERVPAWEALGVVLELANAVASWRSGALEAIKDHAAKAAVGAVNAVLLLSRVSLPQSPEALNVHDRHLLDLAKLMTADPAVGPLLLEGSLFGKLWEVYPRWAKVGPFGPLWTTQAPELLVPGQLAWRADILVPLAPHMPARSTVLVSAEFSHAPTDVYAELRMPRGKGSRPDDPQPSSDSQERLKDNVVADLKALGSSCVRIKEQMVAFVQERLDALAGKTFGSFAANKTVVDELNAILEGQGIRLLYVGPKEEYRNRVVNVRVYDHPDATAGQFFVRLAEAGAKKVSAENEFPTTLKTAAVEPTKEQL